MLLTIVLMPIHANEGDDYSLFSFIRYR